MAGAQIEARGRSTAHAGAGMIGRREIRTIGMQTGARGCSGGLTTLDSEEQSRERRYVRRNYHRRRERATKRSTSRVGGAATQMVAEAARREVHTCG